MQGWGAVGCVRRNVQTLLDPGSCGKNNDQSADRTVYLATKRSPGRSGGLRPGH